MPVNDRKKIQESLELLGAGTYVFERFVTKSPILISATTVSFNQKL